MIPRAKEITRPLAHPLDTLSKSRKAAKRSDGRCEHLCDYLRAKVGVLDGTEADNRRAVWTLILKAEATQPDGDAVRSIETLIDIATAPDNWHAKNVTNFRYLLNHAGQIARAHRERKPTGNDKARSIVEAQAKYYADINGGTGGGAG